MSQIEKYGSTEAPSLAMIQTWERTAAVLAKSSMVPERFKDKPADIIAVAFTMHSLDLPLTPHNLQRFYCPKQGVVAFDAQIYARQADQHGWELWFNDDNNADHATAYLQRRGDPTSRVHSYTFTWDDAVRAGVGDKDTYKKWPQLMLAYKACTHLIRRVCPQVLMGVPNLYDDDRDDPFRLEVSAGRAKSQLIAAIVNAGLAEQAAVTVAKAAWEGKGWGSDPVHPDDLARLVADTVAGLPTGEVAEPVVAPVDADPEPAGIIDAEEVPEPEPGPVAAGQASLLNDPERPF